MCERAKANRLQRESIPDLDFGYEPTGYMKLEASDEAIKSIPCNVLSYLILKLILLRKSICILLRALLNPFALLLYPFGQALDLAFLNDSGY